MISTVTVPYVSNQTIVSASAVQSLPTLTTNIPVTLFTVPTVASVLGSIPSVLSSIPSVVSYTDVNRDKHLRHEVTDDMYDIVINYCIKYY